MGDTAHAIPHPDTDGRYERSPRWSAGSSHASSLQSVDLDAHDGQAPDPSSPELGSTIPNGDYRFASVVSLFEVSDRLGGLAQLMVLADYRLETPGLNELFDNN